MSRKQKEALEGFVYILPSFAILLVFYLIPIVMSGYYSFTSYNLMTAPKFVGFSNYAKLFQDEYIRDALKNTLIYTIVTVPVQTILALIFAAFLAVKMKNKKGELLRSLIFIPVIASAVTSGAIWSILMDANNGVINRVLTAVGLPAVNWLGSAKVALISVSIVGIWKNVGYFMVICYAGIMGISQEVYEAAKIDGAGNGQIFRMITVPLLKPVIYLSVTLGIIWSFQVFDLSYVMTGGGPGRATVTLVMAIYQQAFKGGNKMGYASAIAMLLLVIIIVINLLENLFFAERKEGRRG